MIPLTFYNLELNHHKKIMYSQNDHSRILTLYFKIYINKKIHYNQDKQNYTSKQFISNLHVAKEICYIPLLK